MAREEEKVYCAQYINDCDSQEYYEGAKTRPDVYSHYRDTEICSIYMGSENAFL